MKLAFAAAAALAVLANACSPQERGPAQEPARPYVLAASEIEAGRHLVLVGGCNDCHTAGFAQTAGQIPESDWLKGSSEGNYGPWGTTYASNLRLVAARMSAEDWATMLQTREGLPPMPWVLMREYDPRDLRAIHAYIRSLGDPGEAVPAAIPPGAPPQGFYVDFLTHGAPPPGAAPPAP